MPKRRPHSKSRRGCQNCKTRHIKCDEQGPPCANCVARKTTSSCTYASQMTRHPRMPVSPSQDAPAPSPISSSLLSLDRMSLCPVPRLDETNRLLELELMNRWSTRTWTCLYVVPECRPYLQEHLPRAALQNGYLLRGIFALAAADLAFTSTSNNATSLERSRYFHAALRYGNEAAAEFRSQVRDVTQQNLDLLVYFAYVMAALNFLTPVEGMSALERFLKYFDMLHTSLVLCAANMTWLIEGPCSMGTIVKEYSADAGLMKAIDARTMAALEILSSVGRKVKLLSRSSSPLSQEADSLRAVATLEGNRSATASGTMGDIEGENLTSYDVAIAQTKYCFAEDAVGRMKGYFITIIPAAGNEFVAGVRSHEPLAMFVLLYFGVLVDRASRDPMMWLLGSAGRDFVAETSRLVMLSDIAGVEGVVDGVAWARGEVGLPPLGACVDSLPED